MEGKRKKKNVMVAVDESESSYYFLIWVLENLQDLIENSKLFIFASQPFPLFNHTVFSASLGYAQLYCPFSTKGTWLAQEQNMKVSLVLLEKAKRICESRGIKAETFTGVGDPKEAICSAVQEHKIDLLVIGQQDQGTLKRVFQGSLSKYCLDNAKCSVLVVKKEKH